MHTQDTTLPVIPNREDEGDVNRYEKDGNTQGYMSGCMLDELHLLFFFGEEQ